MGIYAYAATDAAAALVEGTLIADSPRQARDRLRDQGLHVHEISDAETTGRSRASLLQTVRGVLGRRPDVSGFLRELATLLQVGVPMLEALDTALGAMPRRSGLRRALLGVREKIAAGASLADAFGEALFRGRQVFDEVTVAMTRVGEDAGGLAEVLVQIAAYQERGQQFKSRLGSALAYPLVVLLTGIGVSVFLMTYVVPGLLDSLRESGSQLPWITQLVKGVSDLLVRHGGWLLLAGIVLVAGFIVIRRTSRGRMTLDRWMLQLPGVGEIVRKQAVVRLSFVLSTLMRSGVGFERAIAIAQRSTRNRVLRQTLVECEKAVQEGRDLGDALNASGGGGGGFGGTVVQVFTLGQASGQLEEMLDRLAEGYDRQVSTLTGRLTALLEPVLILLLAVVVGAIAFATILPILEIGNAM